jgi:hypothetical protein
VKHEFVITHTLKKKEQETCASDLQIQVVCASRMLCVCTSCVGAIDHFVVVVVVVFSVTCLGGA